GLGFLKGHCGVDTIVSTNARVVETARRSHLRTIFRVFLLDSIALRTANRTLSNIQVDAIEVLPGAMAKAAISQIRASGPNRT
ncbi:glycerol-3-phosphate responsive antiterminator, partial [Xanthomonas citri pv. citri]|nr:glycerol-3-phosphate responsive antiterminator [Xanthomonas citri pv. citri]